MLFGNDQTVGTCSLCGGPVRVPSVWWSVVRPTPTCAYCGAQAKENHGPVIDMTPRPRYFPVFPPVQRPIPSRNDFRRAWRRLLAQPLR